MSVIPYMRIVRIAELSEACNSRFSGLQCYNENVTSLASLSRSISKIELTAADAKCVTEQMLTFVAMQANVHEARRITVRPLPIAGLQSALQGIIDWPLRRITYNKEILKEIDNSLGSIAPTASSNVLSNVYYNAIIAGVRVLAAAREMQTTMTALPSITESTAAKLRAHKRVLSAAVIANSVALLVSRAPAPFIELAHDDTKRFMQGMTEFANATVEWNYRNELAEQKINKVVEEYTCRMAEEDTRLLSVLRIPICAVCTEMGSADAVPKFNLLMPCGHATHEGCAAKTKVCPECRATVDSITSYTAVNSAFADIFSRYDGIRQIADAALPFQDSDVW